MWLRVKKQKVLKTIYEQDFHAKILWKEVELFLMGYGVNISKGNGSRIRIYMNGVRAVFHKPFSDIVCDKGSLKSLKSFLKNAGIKDVKI